MSSDFAMLVALSARGWTVYPWEALKLLKCRKRLGSLFFFGGIDIDYRHFVNIIYIFVLHYELYWIIYVYIMFICIYRNLPALLSSFVSPARKVLSTSRMFLRSHRSFWNFGRGGQLATHQLPFNTTTRRS